MCSQQNRKFEVWHPDSHIRLTGALLYTVGTVEILFQKDCIGDSTETDNGTGVDELHRYLTGGIEETQETSARIAKIIEESN